MQVGEGNGRTRVVGREAELVTLREFLAGSAPSALVLSGEPGIGKSTLWEASLGSAGSAGLRVLSARASDGEAQLASAAITDLLEEITALGELGLPVRSGTLSRSRSFAPSPRAISRSTRGRSRSAC